MSRLGPALQRGAPPTTGPLMCRLKPVSRREVALKPRSAWTTSLTRTPARRVPRDWLDIRPSARHPQLPGLVASTETRPSKYPADERRGDNNMSGARELLYEIWNLGCLAGLPLLPAGPGGAAARCPGRRSSAGTVKTMACTGPGAWWESQPTSQQMNVVIVAPAGVGIEQLPDRVELAGAFRLWFAPGFARDPPGRRRSADACGVRRRRGPRAEPESIPASVRDSRGPPSNGRVRGGEHPCGALPAERLAWSVVDLCGDPNDILHGVDAQVGALREVVAQQPGHVLVAAPLPR